MKNHAINPSVINKVAALKARAISALHANSSLKVRIKRYNHAMAKARLLEAKHSLNSHREIQEVRS